MKNRLYLLTLMLALLGATPLLRGAEPAAEPAAAAAAAPAPPTLDSGNTAWLITAGALVLFMTLPGLALFYGGLVRVKNVLSVLMQCFGIASVITVLWVVYGYSLAFSTTGMEAGVVNLRSFVGSLDKAFLKGVNLDAISGSIPEAVFVMFQLTFAIITPALIVGAFAERMKYAAVMLFAVLWFTFAYLPICHMAWSGAGALFFDWGVLDFAGGTVVHINAGLAGLVACIMVGRRLGHGSEQLRPHNVVLTVVGAAMLWVGWFGFNAGSALAADKIAGMALLVTQVATATAAATWLFIEWIWRGKPTAVGVATGAVAGLVAITPASGTAGPLGALIIGVAAAVCCYVAATKLKAALRYDDSLDVFGVHGVGGIVGALLTGVCADAALGGAGLAQGVTLAGQVLTQLKSIVVTILWSSVVAFLALWIADKVVGLRVSEEVETLGLDLSEHGEEGYHLA